jgi:hypothetical protein
MTKRVLLAFLVLIAPVACRAQAGSVAGDWRGIWTNAGGDVFSARITLEQGVACKDCATRNVSVQGKIVWTLRKVGAKASAEDADKIGTVLTEKVKGENKGDGLLVLNGYEADDPNVLKGIDQYRLALSDDGKVIGGITLAGGSWTGQFIAVKTQ